MRESQVKAGLDAQKKETMGPIRNERWSTGRTFGREKRVDVAKIRRFVARVVKGRYFV
jgi:hypothetical protein